MPIFTRIFPPALLASLIVLATCPGALATGTTLTPLGGTDAPQPRCPEIYPYVGPPMTVAEAYMLIANHRIVAADAVRLAFEYIDSVTIHIVGDGHRGMGFTGLDFSDGYLFQANVPGGGFYKANFENAYLHEINFCGSDMFLANFRGAALNGSNLRNSFIASD